MSDVLVALWYILKSIALIYGTVLLVLGLIALICGEVYIKVGNWEWRKRKGIKK